MSETLNLRVTGMTCGGCENAVTRTLTELAGVESASASHTAQLVRVVYKPESTTPAAIRSAIQTLGYEVQP